MKTIKLLFIFILYISILSCQNQKINQVVHQWANKEIIFPEKLSYSIEIDSIWNNLLSHEYKILVAVDSNTCTECHLKLYEWKKLIQEIDSITNNTAFLFIIHTKDYSLLDIIKENNKFNYPIIYDYDNKIGKLNKFPRNFLFQTFLLDSNNKIILVGNPIGNKYLWDLYKQIITNTLKE